MKYHKRTMLSDWISVRFLGFHHTHNISCVYVCSYVFMSEPDEPTRYSTQLKAFSNLCFSLLFAGWSRVPPAVLTAGPIIWLQRLHWCASSWKEEDQSCFQKHIERLALVWPWCFIYYLEKFDVACEVFINHSLGTFPVKNKSSLYFLTTSQPLVIADWIAGFSLKGHFTGFTCQSQITVLVKESTTHPVKKGTWIMSSMALEELCQV